MTQTDLALTIDMAQGTWELPMIFLKNALLGSQVDH